MKRPWPQGRSGEGGGAPVHDAGKYITIYQRHADDTWVIAHDIWNSNNPLPTQAPGPRRRARQPPVDVKFAGNQDHLHGDATQMASVWFVHRAPDGLLRSG